MLLDSTLSNSFARLISPTFSFNSAGYCLKWYYSMTAGTQIGQLSIYLKSGNTQRLIWQYSQNIGNVWNAAQATIPNQINYDNFTFVIEGKTTSYQYPRSTISVDDVSLEVGVCSAFGACDFEEGDYCVWNNVNDGRDNFDWEFGSHETSSTGTGPL